MGHSTLRQLSEQQQRMTQLQKGHEEAVRLVVGVHMLLFRELMVWPLRWRGTENWRLQRHSMKNVRVKFRN